jgi:hypothetical protein
MSNEPQTKPIDDILAFPVLTREVGTTAPSASPAGAPGATGAAPIAKVIENALRNVLGWRPRMDSNAFLAALNQSFTCTEVEGKMECQWTPRGAALGVQADLGGVTGAQASLYARARNTLDQVLPLLDGLRPLRSESDPEDTQSMRAIIRSEIVELVNELGILGGPRIPRVNQLFRLLMGIDPEDPAAIGAQRTALQDPEKVGGQLSVLQERFGLTRDRVNTPAEEQTLTNRGRAGRSDPAAGPGGRGAGDRGQRRRRDPVADRRELQLRAHRPPDDEGRPEDRPDPSRPRRSGRLEQQPRAGHLQPGGRQRRDLDRGGAEPRSRVGRDRDRDREPDLRPDERAQRTTASQGSQGLAQRAAMNDGSLRTGDRSHGHRT